MAEIKLRCKISFIVVLATTKINFYETSSECIAKQTNHKALKKVIKNQEIIEKK